MLATSRSFVAILLVGAMLSTSACANLSKRDQRVLSGGAIGAAAGAVVGAVTGVPILTGVAIGAAAGAVGGYMYDRNH